MKKIFRVNKDFNETRLDRWFKRNVKDLPQSLIEKLIRKKKILLNNNKTKSSFRVKFNDEILIADIDKFAILKKENQIYKANELDKRNFDKFIIENNENFIVINKPTGIPVQSGTKSFKNLIDIIKQTKYFFLNHPYIVHRLDKETSGVMIIAKNRVYAQLFTSLFRIRKIHKTYLAIVYGNMKNFKKNHIIKENFVKIEKGKKIFQKTISYLNVIKNNDNYSYIEIKPVTGRKHQIRKQLFNLGHPIVGDKKYFLGKKTNNNLLLHSYKINFIIKNLKYSYKSKFSNEFDTFIKKNL